MFEMAEKFHSLLPEIRYPIIQAPMAGTATPELVAAVSNAGAMGSLGIGFSSPEKAREMIEQTRTLTDKPFNANVFCHQSAPRDLESEKLWLNHLDALFSEFGAEPPVAIDEVGISFRDSDDMLQVLLETRPAVVSFHFGLPQPHQLNALRDAGIFLFATATNLEDAKALVTAGVDAIVAQGIEAGGHRGLFDPDQDDQRLSTTVLVRLLTQHLQVPVIAAGGIMDGYGVRAMLDIGAVAAQMGTAFILCPETAANDGYRNALKSERTQSTRLTKVLTGRPARGMTNRYIDHSEQPGSPQPPAYPLATDAARKLAALAEAVGNFAFTAHWAGQGAPLAREMSASGLVSTLVEEMNSSRNAR